MRSSDSPLVAVAARAFGVLAVAFLSACASSGSSPPKPGLFASDANKNVVTVQSDNAVTPEMFLASGYCPPIQIRPGTESLMVYEKGHEEDPEYVRYQGSITRTARECHTSGALLMLKVGIAGRLAAGPKGGAGNYTLPLRVAVIKQHGDTIFYSEVQKVPVTLAAPDFGADFSTVIDNISFEVGPGDRDLIIFIGYDEGKPKPPAPTG